VYLTAAPLLCLDPSELMMVAAHPGDLKAARRAGLRSAFIERPLEYGPGSLARADSDADESAVDLSELAARLEEPA
jgi:2-haloacid dehalogenase